MRLLQHSVRNAFVICVLLISVPVIAADTYYTGYSAGSAGGDTSASYLTITSLENSSTTERQTLSCLWYGVQGSFGYQRAVVPCSNSQHQTALKPVCTIDGQPYSPGMNVQGVSYEIYQRYINQTNTYDVTVMLPLVASNSYTTVFLGVKATRDGFHVGDLSGAYLEARVECTYTNVYQITSLGSYMGSLQPSIVYPVIVRVDSMLSVSVEQPSPVIGKLMREFDAPFKMTVTNALPSENLSMTWDVGAPCDSWSPSLRLPDGSVLGIHHADSGRLPSGTSIMTAKFTPTALGAFSCTGTLNVSLD
ncbi:hypothetical protein P9911_004085 [Klebsiella oxytoca]|uniref:hypothetical protein n=1 Tax=Klebsiella oxytoca TaxID=571 RepID=UPI00254BBF32|nr:hypothetical protein [Klebsiella oxytoca]MEC5505029.1 hypothetical protein [Klebsiella oxytoca]